MFTLRRHLTSILLLILVASNSLTAQTERTTVYGVLLDNTRSLEKQFPQVVMISKRVVHHIHQRGCISLFNFVPKRDVSSIVVPSHDTDRYEGGNYDRAIGALGLECTQAQDALSHYVDGLSVVRGQTDLFGAVSSIAEFLNTQSNSTSNAEKIMILITDGDHRMEMIGRVQPTETDDERRKREKQLIKTVKQYTIKVYAIGLTRDLSSGSLVGDSRRSRAESFLKKITKETGGRVVFPQSKNIDINSLLSELLGQ